MRFGPFPARTPNTFMRKEPAPFNFSGDFPIEANSLSAFNYNNINQFLSCQFLCDVTHALTKCIHKETVGEIYVTLTRSARILISYAITHKASKAQADSQFRNS